MVNQKERRRKGHFPRAIMLLSATDTLRKASGEDGSLATERKSLISLSEVWAVLSRGFPGSTLCTFNPTTKRACCRVRCQWPRNPFCHNIVSQLSLRGLAASVCLALAVIPPVCLVHLCAPSSVGSSPRPSILTSTHREPGRGQVTSLRMRGRFPDSLLLFLCL